MQQRLRPILRHKNKGGAPRGNRNAVKHGAFSMEVQAERAKIKALVRRSKSALLLAERILRKRRKARAMRAALRVLKSD